MLGTALSQRGAEANTILETGRPRLGVKNGLSLMLGTEPRTQASWATDTTSEELEM